MLKRRFLPDVKGFERFAAKAGYSGTGLTSSKAYAHGTLYLEWRPDGVEFRRVNGTGRLEVVTWLHC